MSEWHTSGCVLPHTHTQGWKGYSQLNVCGRECAGFDEKFDLMVLVLQPTSNGDVYFFVKGFPFLMWLIDGTGIFSKFSLFVLFFHYNFSKLSEQVKREFILVFELSVSLYFEGD